MQEGFNIFVSARARRDLKKLPPQLRHPIAEAIDSLAQNPFSGDYKFLHGAVARFRRRVGDYRILFDVEERAVYILRVQHRKEVYRH